MNRLRSRLTYANVTATLALFIALGGTSYAVSSLPRNSVGAKQLRKGSVTSRAVKDRTIALRDIARQARRALSGAAGPQGPKGDSGLVLHAAMNSAGAIVRGNAAAGGSAPGPGAFVVQWATDVSACDAVATLALVPGGPIEEP